MHSFQEECYLFDLSNLFFFFLQARLAYKSNDVPLGAKFPFHPLMDWVNSLPTRRFLSVMYSKLLSGQQKNICTEHRRETSI